jgi:hypothetical protein
LMRFVPARSTGARADGMLRVRYDEVLL